MHPTRLLLVTDRHATRGRPLTGVVAAALEGGVRAVQLREKDLGGADLLRLAVELRALTRRFGARLLVNERADVALACEADGVVLPADSLPAPDARALLGAAAVVGRSTHSSAEVAAAGAEGADFAIFGPVHETPSKARFGAPQGLGRLREAAGSGLPVWAVGGIDAANAAEARAAGAAGVAVIRAVLAADDPAAAARELLEAVGEPREGAR